MQKIAPQRLFIVLFAEWYIVNSVKVKHLKCVSNSFYAINYILLLLLLMMPKIKSKLHSTHVFETIPAK